MLKNGTETGDFSVNMECLKSLEFLKYRVLLFVNMHLFIDTEEFKSCRVVSYCLVFSFIHLDN